MDLFSTLPSLSGRLLCWKLARPGRTKAGPSPWSISPGGWRSTVVACRQGHWSTVHPGTFIQVRQELWEGPRRSTAQGGSYIALGCRDSSKRGWAELSEAQEMSRHGGSKHSRWRRQKITVQRQESTSKPIWGWEAGEAEAEGRRGPARGGLCWDGRVWPLGRAGLATWEGQWDLHFGKISLSNTFLFFFIFERKDRKCWWHNNIYFKSLFFCLPLSFKLCNNITIFLKVSINL